MPRKGSKGSSNFVGVAAAGNSPAGRHLELEQHASGARSRSGAAPPVSRVEADQQNGNSPESLSWVVSIFRRKTLSTLLSPASRLPPLSCAAGL